MTMTERDNMCCLPGSTEHLDLDDIVERMCQCDSYSLGVRHASCKPLPSKDAIVSLVELARTAIFPRCFGPEDLDKGSQRFYLGATLDRMFHILKEQIHRGLCFQCEGDKDHCRQCELEAEEKATRFISHMPELARLMNLDVEETYRGDPAATSRDEIIFSYPGLTATLAYRLAHELHLMKAPVIARIMTEYAHSVTGIDIHPGANIGESFMIDHGTGVVIGETCLIGNHVHIYQGVTLGAKSFPTDSQGNPIRGKKRHPTLEDNVVIYSGATILGAVIIGTGSVIGGNVWLTESVPPGTRVIQGRYSQQILMHGAGI